VGRIVTRAQCAWINRRIRYRNRHGFSAARRFGIPRAFVGRGCSIACTPGGSCVLVRWLSRPIVECVALEYGAAS